MIARWLRRLADYLDPPVVAYAHDPYRDITTALIVDAEARLGAGFGDAKRRDVYAALMKRFPRGGRGECRWADLGVGQRCECATSPECAGESTDLALGEWDGLYPGQWKAGAPHAATAAG